MSCPPRLPHLATTEMAPATKSKHQLTTQALTLLLKALSGRNPTARQSSTSVLRLMARSSTRTGMRNTHRITKPHIQNTVREGLSRRYRCRFVLEEEDTGFRASPTIPAHCLGKGLNVRVFLETSREKKNLTCRPF